MMKKASTVPDLDLSTLQRQPVFVFTTDIDWAPEWAIQEMLRLFDHEQMPLTPFLTHDSAALRARYGTPSMRARAGLHPNFLPGSSHGERPEQVIDSVCRLWPEAHGFRSHC